MTNTWASAGQAIRITASRFGSSSNKCVCCMRALCPPRLNQPAGAEDALPHRTRSSPERHKANDTEQRLTGRNKKRAFLAWSRRGASPSLALHCRAVPAEVVASVIDDALLGEMTRSPPPSHLPGLWPPLLPAALQAAPAASGAAASGKARRCSRPGPLFGSAQSSRGRCWCAAKTRRSSAGSARGLLVACHALQT